MSCHIRLNIFLDFSNSKFDIFTKGVRHINGFMNWIYLILIQRVTFLWNRQEAQKNLGRISTLKDRWDHGKDTFIAKPYSCIKEHVKMGLVLFNSWRPTCNWLKATTHSTTARDRHTDKHDLLPSTTALWGIQSQVPPSITKRTCRCCRRWWLVSLLRTETIWEVGPGSFWFLISLGSHWCLTLTPFSS